MTLAFTLCSINYLAQARTLGDSLKRTNPHIRYVIGLVDRLDAAQVPDDKLPDFELLELHRIGIDGLDEMCKQINFLLDDLQRWTYLISAVYNLMVTMNSIKLFGLFVFSKQCLMFILFRNSN